MAGHVVTIADAADPRIEGYRALQERDLKGRHGLFVAESEVVVRVLAARGRFPIRSLLLEERRVEPLRDVIATLDDVPVYVAPQQVMDAIAGFAIHRGVLALGDRGAELDPATILGERVAERGEVVVALVGLTNHDNVGSVFRNAAAFGARGVLFDRTTCDPLYRKAIRVSAGAALVVPFARFESADTMLDRLARDGWEAIALSPRGEESLAELPRGRRRALILGTEGEGLPDSVMDRARRVRIDMEPTLDSLNVAVASGVALYEAMRRR